MSVSPSGSGKVSETFRAINIFYGHRIDKNAKGWYNLNCIIVSNAQLTLRLGYYNHSIRQVAILFNKLILCVQGPVLMFVQIKVILLFVNGLWIFRNERSGVMLIGYIQNFTAENIRRSSQICFRFVPIHHSDCIVLYTRTRLKFVLEFLRHITTSDLKQVHGRPVQVLLRSPFVNHYYKTLIQKHAFFFKTIFLFSYFPCLDFSRFWRCYL